MLRPTRNCLSPGKVCPALAPHPGMVAGTQDTWYLSASQSPATIHTNLKGYLPHQSSREGSAGPYALLSRSLPVCDSPFPQAREPLKVDTLPSPLYLIPSSARVQEAGQANGKGPRAHG